MVLVISPLIALMEAQVFDMNRANIPACLVGSAQPDPNILLRIHSGEFNIIYSSPEYLQLAPGKHLLNMLKNRLILIAIDGMGFFKIIYFQTLNERSHIIFSSFTCLFRNPKPNRKVPLFAFKNKLTALF